MKTSVVNVGLKKFASASNLASKCGQKSAAAISRTITSTGSGLIKTVARSSSGILGTSLGLGLLGTVALAGVVAIGTGILVYRIIK